MSKVMNLHNHLKTARCMLKISLVLELDVCKIMSSQLCVKILIILSYMLGRMIWQQTYQLIKWQNQLSMSLKSDSSSVAISNIPVRTDKHKNKVRQTNKHLKTLCMERNIELINQDSTITEKRLNGSRLHGKKYRVDQSGQHDYRKAFERIQITS